MSENSPSKTLKFRNLLWKLHYKLEKKSTHTSFEELTDNPKYRASVLDELVKSDDLKLVELASKILEQEALLGIGYELDDGETLDSIENKATPSQNESKKTPSKQKSGSKKFIILLLLFIVLFISILAINQFFTSDAKPISTVEKIVVPVTSTTNSKNIPTIKTETSTLDPKSDQSVLSYMKDKVTTLAPKQKPIDYKMILRLHGSNTVGEKLAPTLITAYLKNMGATDINITGENEVEKTIKAELPKQGWVEVEIKAHGSSTSFQDLNNGSADMGMASRKIKSKEVTLLKPKFGDMTLPINEHVLGLDGLAIIVNKANPLSQFNTKQLAGLFSGEITNWSQVGGNDLPVSIYSRDGNSGTWDTFKNLVLKKYKKKLSPTASRYESSSELSDLVANDPNAIGFIGLPYVNNSKLVAVADDVNSQAIIPTLFTVGTEDYPLSRRLYFYTPSKKSPFMTGFVEFTHSQAGQKLVKEVGFISQNIYTVKPTVPDDAPEFYKNVATKSERLSLNFRFKTGSNNLDNKALRDLERLTIYMENHPEKQLSLLGFSDSIGEEKYNVYLSQVRAEKIEAALQSRGIYSLVTKGLGEQMPVASNGSKSGRNKNRRVEVWVSE